MTTPFIRLHWYQWIIKKKENHVSNDCTYQRTSHVNQISETAWRENSETLTKNLVTREKKSSQSSFYFRTPFSTKKWVTVKTSFFCGRYWIIQTRHTNGLGTYKVLARKPSRQVYDWLSFLMVECIVDVTIAIKLESVVSCAAVGQASNGMCWARKRGFIILRRSNIHH